MNISAPFIQRPVATALLMVGLLLCGLGAYRLAGTDVVPNLYTSTLFHFREGLLAGMNPALVAAAVAEAAKR